MIGIRFKHKGDFSKTERFFNKLLSRDYLNVAEKYAKAGVEALAAATPVDTGETAASWNYRIESGQGKTEIIFTNSHVEKGVNIAIILQYGHGTRNGGYVVGRDYINPAIQPVFDDIVKDAWEEVVKI